VRKLCTAYPGTEERLSHGEPTFFAGGKVFVMFANDHHGDGHIAIWLPVPEGMQAALIRKAPKVFFRPPYVGVKGWIGIDLTKASDARLRLHIDVAWHMVAPRKLQTSLDACR
jgi:hypothetical protein